MAKVRADQAEGLRRMLVGAGLRVLTLLSGHDGVGKTTVAIHLAHALASSGREVLLIDENCAEGNASSALGAHTRVDLADVIDGAATLEQALVAGAPGLRVLAAARAAQLLPAIEQEAAGRLGEYFGALAIAPDYVLIDSAAGAASRLVALDADSQEVVIVLSRRASSITEAYALIKRMNQSYAQRDFHVIVNRVASEQEALVIYRNMAEVARGYLDVTLDFVGFVPADEQLAQAGRLGRSALEAFPGCAAAASFRQLAETVAEWPIPHEPAGGLQRYVERLLRGSRIAAETIVAAAPASQFK